MGVQGLWQLLQPTGKPVSLQSLEGKILAIDVSIWLHQAMKGMRDAHGDPLPNAHLQILFNRVCKLLCYKIKPVFVFDGGVPILKRQTLAARRERMQFAERVSSQTNQRLLQNLMESEAVKHILGKTSTPSTASVTKAYRKGDDNLFELPPLPEEFKRQQEEDGNDAYEERMLQRQIIADNYDDLTGVDVDSEDFLALPAEIQHEIMMEIMQDRKQNSWSKMHEFPEEAGNFSSFQMSKILKQSRLASRLDEVRKEMISNLTMDVTKQLMGDDYYEEGMIQSQRVVSDDTAHFILIKGLNKKRREEELAKASSLYQEKVITAEQTNSENDSSKSNSEIDDQLLADSDEEREKRKKLLQMSWTYDDTGTSSQTLFCVESKAGCSHDYSDSFPAADVVDICDVAESQLVNKTNVHQNQAGNILSINTDKHSKKNHSATKHKQKLSVDAQKQNKIVISDEDISSTSQSSKTLHEASAQNPSSKALHEASAQKRSSKTFHQASAQKQKEILIANESVIDSPKTTHNEDKMDHTVQNAEDEATARKRLRLDTNKENTAPLKQNNESSEESDDEGFIEINVDPDKVVQDDLFPADIFVSCDSQDKVIADTGQETVVTEHSIPVNKSLEMTNSEEDSKPEKEVIHRELPISPDTNNFDIAKEFKDYMQDTGKLTSIRRDELKMLRERTLQLRSVINQQEQENLEEYQEDLEKEGTSLRREKGKQERLASSITDEIHSEAQELLKLFGLPFIVSPTEAESQCAFLDISDQTDGTITDDSDIWLFGGKHVYKNFFNQDKHVEFFTDGCIERKLGLRREQMINFALLCGSDYTEGIRKVGPVSAIEIMAEFPGKGIEGLKKFKDWWDQVQIKTPEFEDKKRAKLRKLEINPGFPNPAVVEAYLQPHVDLSTDKFSWARPDLDLLRDFANEKFGWSKKKVDDLLLPVMKQINSTQTQGRIDQYFQPENFLPAKKMRSTRIHDALSKLTSPSELPALEETKQEKKSLAAQVMALSQTEDKNQTAESEALSKVSQVKVTSESKSKGQIKGRGKGKAILESNSKGQGKGRGKGKAVRKGKAGILQGKRSKFTIKNEVALSESSSSDESSSSEESSSSDESCSSEEENVRNRRGKGQMKDSIKGKKKGIHSKTGQGDGEKLSQKIIFDSDVIEFMKEEENMSLDAKQKTHSSSLKKGTDKMNKGKNSKMNDTGKSK